MSSVTDRLYDHASKHRRLGDSRRAPPPPRDQKPTPSAKTMAKRETVYSHPASRERRAEESRTPPASLVAMINRHQTERNEMNQRHRQEHLALTSKHQVAEAELPGRRNGAAVPREVREAQQAERDRLNKKQEREQEFLASQHAYQKSLLKK